MKIPHENFLRTSLLMPNCFHSVSIFEFVQLNKQFKFACKKLALHNNVDGWAPKQNQINSITDLKR